MIFNPEHNSGHHRRNNNQYQILRHEVEQFNNLGYVVLKNVLTEAELDTIDPWFDHFIMGHEKEKMRKDFCDMSQPYDTPFEEFQLVNAMMPGTYRKEFANNIFSKVAHNIATQLYETGKPDMDYEQFLAKKPSKEKAEFAMHQDLGYWPKTKNTWTATFSLALTDADQINGCLHLIPGSNKEAELRNHRPKDDSRDASHTLVIEAFPNEKVIFLPVKRGDVTIHDARIVHGSGGNHSDIWRKTYIIAFRDVETIKEERAMGFTHSHNDQVNWKGNQFHFNEDSEKR